MIRERSNSKMSLRSWREHLEWSSCHWDIKHHSNKSTSRSSGGDEEFYLEHELEKLFNVQVEIWERRGALCVTRITVYMLCTHKRSFSYCLKIYHVTHLHFQQQNHFYDSHDNSSKDIPQTYFLLLLNSPTVKLSKKI